MIKQAAPVENVILKKCEGRKRNNDFCDLEYRYGAEQSAKQNPNYEPTRVAWAMSCVKNFMNLIINPI